MGGLLGTTEHGLAATHFSARDGNGNVTALVDGTGTITARYEYTPFGEALRVEGPAARAHPFRFSTKFTTTKPACSTTATATTAPPSPAGSAAIRFKKRVGWNLYGFVGNDPVASIDPDGESKRSARNRFHVGHRKKKNSDQHGNAKGHGGRDNKPNFTRQPKRWRKGQPVFGLMAGTHMPGVFEEAAEEAEANGIELDAARSSQPLTKTRSPQRISQIIQVIGLPTYPAGTWQQQNWMQF